MTGKTLAHEVSKKESIPRKCVEAVQTAIFDEIIKRVSNGEQIQIIGFGTFEVAERAPRTGRNPRTGEVINLPGRKSPVFRAGKNFKATVNGERRP